MLITPIVKKPVRIPSLALLFSRLAIHLVSSLYLTYVLYLAFSGQLIGDPVQYLIDFTGIGAINLLLLSLLVSPLALTFKMAQLMRLRRSLGVYAAVYAIAHICVFISFELQFEWGLIVSEILKRPYITVGFGALVILIVLLVTSINHIKKRMGSSWAKLHKLVYLATALILIHYIWSIKSEELQPIVYFILGGLILFVRGKKLNFFKT